MSLFRDMFDDLDAFGRFWLVLGLGSLAAAAAMSFDFGWGVSAKHALFLAVLSVVAAFGPMAAEMLFTRGRKYPAIATALICIPMLGIEFYSHAGYTAGLRGSNIETATVQNTKWTGAQEAVNEDKTNLALWIKRLGDLEAANAWTGTVTADALRAKLAGLNLAIEQEAARGGCKAKCLARTQERDDVASKIAIAEERGELSKKIEATKRVLDKQRDKTAHTDLGNSAVVEQSAAFAKLANWDLKPDADAIEWTKYIIGVLIAVVTVIIAPTSFKLAFLIAGMAGIGIALSRRKDEEDERTAQTAPLPRAPSAPEATDSIADLEIWKALNKALNTPGTRAA